MEESFWPMIDDLMFAHIMYTNKEYLIEIVSYITKIPKKLLKI